MANTLQLIKALPLKLQEKILKDYIKIKLKERSDLGWGKVNNEIYESPYCDSFKRIAKVYFCSKHENCLVNKSICVPCRKKNKNCMHFLKTCRKKNVYIPYYPCGEEINIPKGSQELCKDDNEHDNLITGVEDYMTESKNLLQEELLDEIREELLEEEEEVSQNYAPFERLYELFIERWQRL